MTALAAAIALSLATAGAALPGLDAALPSPAAGESTNLPVFKTVGPGVLELGKVRIDKEQRTVSFPAVLNQGRGLVEYLLVTAYGKTHESILRTDASPLHIHVAMLLLNAKGTGTNLLSAPPPAYGGTPGLRIPGDPITLEVRWRQGGSEKVRKAEELVLSQEAGTEMRNVSWVYTGSMVWQGTFLAQRDGSLISLISDPVALVNTAGPGHDEAHVWTANPDKLPPPNRQVQVTIKLVDLGPKK